MVDFAPLGRLEPAEALLERMADLSARLLRSDVRRPITVRFRMPDADAPVGEAETEVRFKVRIPRSVVEAGDGAVRGFAADSVASFEELLACTEVIERVERDPD